MRQGKVRHRSSSRAHVLARRATVAVGAGCSAAGWLIAGVDGFLGAVAATLLVVLFLSSGLVPVLMVQRAGVTAGVGLLVLLLTYTLRLALALLALALLGQLGGFDRAWLGSTVIAGALTWSAVHVVAAIRDHGDVRREELRDGCDQDASDLS